MTDAELKARLQAMIDTFVQDERAAVVAWLRKRASEIANWPPGGENEISLTYKIIADDIERGEHRKENNR